MVGKNKTNIWFLLMVAILPACVQPVGTEGFDFSYEDTPVVNCFFTPAKPFCVHVSLTASMYLDTAYTNIEDAVVRIIDENDTEFVLPHIGDGYYRDDNVHPRAGVLYTLYVEVPGYGSLQASDSIPSNVSRVEFIGHEEDAWIDEDGDFFDGLNFIIHDVSSVNNYYEFVEWYGFNSDDGSVLDSISNGSSSFLNSNDPAVKQNGSWQAIFSDELFNGNNYPIQMIYYVSNIWSNSNSHSAPPWVEVIQGSYAFYTYRLTYLKHDEALYADFWDPMEPIIMYSNIENGYGIFAGYHSQLIETNYTD